MRLKGAVQTMDYKKIIKSQKTRIRILNMLRFLPTPFMLKLQYRIQLGRSLNLKNPKRYTEKIQWLKAYYKDPLMKTCVDKYDVRKYIERKGLGEILNECYGIYESIEEIDISKLPNKFVLKKTNGGGGLNIITCEDKNSFTLDRAILNDWLRPTPPRSLGREWAYDGLKSRIIIEKYLDDPGNPYGGINDYKIQCFNGKAFIVIVDIGRYSNHRRNFYTTDWKRIPISSDHDNFEPDLEKPQNLDELIKISEILASDFPEVRVDLYNINGTIIFGELTFYPWSGYVQFKPDEADYKIGDMFSLPNNMM